MYNILEQCGCGEYSKINVYTEIESNNFGWQIQIKGLVIYGVDF